MARRYGKKHYEDVARILRETSLQAIRLDRNDGAYIVAQVRAKFIELFIDDAKEFDAQKFIQATMLDSRRPGE